MPYDGYAAGGAGAAYNPPAGSATTIGTASFHFLNLPLTMKWWQFLGVAFILFVIARHWGKFVNEILK